MHYNWDKMTDTQKIQAIDKELSFETHMGVTKDDLMNMIRYMRGQFEVIDAQPTTPERTAQVSPWRSINDTAGLGDCEPVIARKLFSEWYEYEIIIFDHHCHGCKGFRANVDCNEGWTEYQRIPGYQYSVNDSLEAK